MTIGALERADRWTALALALAFAGVYLLGTGGTRPYGDGDYQYQLSERIYAKGRVDMEGKSKRWLFPGPDQRQYTTFSLGVGLSYLPSVAVRKMMPRQIPQYAWAVAHRAASTLYGALAVALLFLLARRLAVSRRVAVRFAVVAALATQLWAYVHSDFSEAYQSLALIWAVYTSVAAARHDAGVGAGLHLGAAWGHLILAKTVYYAVLPVGGVFLLAAHWGDWRRLSRITAAGVAVFLPFVAVALGYNLVRTGALMDTGRRFDHFAGPLDGSLFVGLHGLLFSSGKGVFWFNPVLIGALFGVAAFRRAAGRAAIFVYAVVAILLLVYSKYVFWHGAWSFGPRFLTCLVPLALLPLCWVPAFQGAGTRLGRWALAGLIVTSLGVQVLANSFYEGHSIHANNKARRALLGKSARDRCGHCHENHYPVHFVPQFSPIAMHAWMLAGRITGRDDAAQAQAAPWSRWFPEALNAKVEPQRPPLDWWFSRWGGKRPGDARYGWIFLGVAGVLLIGGAAAGRRARRC